MTDLRWGIIGCGDVVERKSGPSIQQAGRSRIVAAMRRDGAKARDFAQRFNVPFATDNAQAVMDHPDVNVVYVATPPSSHLEYVRAAAAARKPVLVEKPMAMSAAQGREMVELCRAAGVPLFVAYYRRFMPHVQAMRRLIAEGRIGRPVQAQVDLAARGPEKGWRYQPEIGGGGMFIDIGSHRTDVMFYLMGEAVEVCGVRTRFDPTGSAEQGGIACLRFRSGALGSVSGDYYSGRRADRFVIHGTAGDIIAENLDSQKFQLHTRPGVEEFAFDLWSAPHLGLIRHIESVLLDGATNESSGEDGVRTEEVLDLMRR